MKNDGLITIAIGRNRKELKWKNQIMKWSEFLSRVCKTTRTPETCEEYKKLPKIEQDNLKDVGGFVGGALREGKRKSDAVLSRCLITLDADYGQKGLWDIIEMLFDFGCAMYTTHKHSPDFPRLRLVIPLSRSVSSEEYGAVSRKIAEDIGIDYFDDTTYEPSRLMYWPSTSLDGEFVFKYQDSQWLNPDEILSRYENWQDTSFWPESSRNIKRREKLADKQGNPSEKGGVVGAFCRTYNILGVIEKFLSEVYVTCVMENRYTYTKGTTAGGLVIYEKGDFAYSHHGTDPASGKLCNAFDLVRLHKFGALDDETREGTPMNKMPSFKAMQELAMKDSCVKSQIALEHINEASEDFSSVDNWAEQLEINAKGGFKETLTNLVLIIKHDPALVGIAYNEHSERIETLSEVPWKRLKAGWSLGDDAGLSCYLEKKYKLWSPSKCQEALLKVAIEKSFHPVKEFLKSLPTWDNVPRASTLLIKYLGAADSEYVRAVTRKTLCGAIARVMKPGIKFDTTLILNGPQGIGKSTIFSKLGGKFFSDALSIADMHDKTAAEKLQGSWILEIGELAGIKKVDEDTLKSFLTRQDDKFRASYGRVVEEHPRQCIIVGTTNQEAGFLRDTTGGRRFWPVKVKGSSEFKPWDIKDIDQIWAEVLMMYNKGESLILASSLTEAAETAQIEAFESDEREGIVREYLDKLLPSNWEEMSLYERRGFLRGEGELAVKTVGTLIRDRVCVMEVWCELFGKDASMLRKIDSYEIGGIMRKMEGWEKINDRVQLPIYGRQRVFLRESAGQCGQ
ncbi:virulence-associated E family protein [Clostridium tagluense]|nr:virulence-associated E family protein [Clostridium tagluense]MCB2312107.1 virulence-associated E family protein [Clostridium tagluense]MCB2316708.1 virulence-associated E family protein [Clostridium tagluense]MCB2321552.1 virulence-associated E family protein [Clostridium tagluense]MCB2326577.1 virulence-associated E family protein [Clostridium tagluense]MCB2331300.1 virulence-associated E family protein [Clostridium tagluense]